MISIASDHGGYRLKEHIKAYLTAKGLNVLDCGCDSLESCDYPVFGKAAAQAVTAMWQEQLGITVTAKAVTAEEYEIMLTPAEPETTEDSGAAEDAEPVAPFQIAAQTFTAAYNDAKAILGDFYSSNAGNRAGYESEAFDILMESAAAAISPEARDAYLHDAEAILLNDAPVIPLYYAGLSWQLREGLSGLYRAPDGVFFLYHLSQEQAAA